MRILGKVLLATALAGLLTAPMADAEPSAGLVLQSPNELTVVPVNHNGNDSLLEIDRSLNLSDGNGTTGSDVVSGSGENEPDEQEPAEPNPEGVRTPHPDLTPRNDI